MTGGRAGLAIAVLVLGALVVEGAAAQTATPDRNYCFVPFVEGVVVERFSTGKPKVTTSFKRGSFGVRADCEVEVARLRALTRPDGTLTYPPEVSIDCVTALRSSAWWCYE